MDKLLIVGLTGGFEADAIRPHVMGRFEDLLLAAVSHPAMLHLYQAQSIGPRSLAGMRADMRADMRAGEGRQRPRGLNENLAREMLELHTLGVRSGYTQGDVNEFARALTGWTPPSDASAGRVAPSARLSSPMPRRPTPMRVLPNAQQGHGAGRLESAFRLAGRAADPPPAP